MIAPPPPHSDSPPALAVGASALLILFLIAPAGCTPPTPLVRPPPAPTATFERAVIVDAPVTAPPPGTIPPPPTAPVAVPSSEPNHTEAITVGQVIILAPVRCGAITLSQDTPRPDCDEPRLASGSANGREFVAAITFDLVGLPAGSEVLYAGLELVGLESDFLADYGRWYVRMVDPLGKAPLKALTYSDLVAAPADLVWRLRSDALSPGGRNTLVFGEAARGALAARLGLATVTFRIDGPSARTNLFSWEAQGRLAPRLRLAYVAEAEAAAALATPLILWDEGGG